MLFTVSESTQKLSVCQPPLTGKRSVNITVSACAEAGEERTRSSQYLKKEANSIILIQMQVLTERKSICLDTGVKIVNNISVCMRL